MTKACLPAVVLAVLTLAGCRDPKPDETATETAVPVVIEVVRSARSAKSSPAAGW